MEADKQAEVYKDFKALVNMTPATLEKWLDTEASKSVGWSEEGGEAIGHHSGRKIVRIKKKKKSELTKDDYSHMQKVVGYIKRHSAQKPKGDTAHTRWAYSLKNWGHDPSKKK